MSDDTKKPRKKAAPAEAKPPEPPGRPTDYAPHYCEQVIEWGKAGKSKAWMAANLGVARQTLDNWCQAHPEFLDAITRAMDLSQAWWEDLGQSHIVSIQGQSLNAGVYSRSMAARFPNDWREKTATELTGAGGGPIKTESNVTLSAEEAYKRLLNGGT